MTIRSAEVTATPINGTITKQVNWSITIDFTLKDEYSFGTTGLFGERLLVPPYKAAHDLEMHYRYRWFDAIGTFTSVVVSGEFNRPL